MSGDSKRDEELERLRRQVLDLTAERDSYRQSFDRLSDAADQLHATRSSYTFRIGRGVTSPLKVTRRLLRAWRRAR